jgi:hypothetical protein
MVSGPGPSLSEPEIFEKLWPYHDMSDTPDNCRRLWEVFRQLPAVSRSVRGRAYVVSAPRLVVG